MSPKKAPLVRFEFSETENTVQELDHIGLSDAEIIELANYRNTLGYWRADLASGHMFWSKNVFRLYGMEYTKGPVNLTIANEMVHPEDLGFILELVERAASEKSGFHFVLRLKDGKNDFKYILSCGRYRVAGDGREELYGMTEEILDQARLINIISDPSLAD